jgi:hypothetical protein
MIKYLSISFEPQPISRFAPFLVPAQLRAITTNDRLIGV